jgi:hypothetical protein
MGKENLISRRLLLTGGIALATQTILPKELFAQETQTTQPVSGEKTNSPWIRIGIISLPVVVGIPTFIYIMAKIAVRATKK